MKNKRKMMCVRRDCMHTFYVETGKCCGIKCPKCGSKGSSVNMKTGKPVF
jgi:hypothetical protein